MPMPNWWRYLNKRVFNPVIRRTGLKPVLTHVGRVSGKTFRIPLDAHPVDGGYLFVLVYGSDTDWVRNTVAAGHARLALGDKTIELINPRIIDDPSGLLSDDVKLPPAFLKVSQYLRMDLADG